LLFYKNGISAEKDAIVDIALERKSERPGHCPK